MPGILTKGRQAGTWHAGQSAWHMFLYVCSRRVCLCVCVCVCVCVTGDPQQLGPNLRSLDAAAKGLSTSLLELLVRCANYCAANALVSPVKVRVCVCVCVCMCVCVCARTQVIWLKRNYRSESRLLDLTLSRARARVCVCVCVCVCTQVIWLKSNYRSESRLLDLPSRLFYQGQLQAWADPHATRTPQWAPLEQPAAVTLQQGTQDPHDTTEQVRRADTHTHTTRTPQWAPLEQPALKTLQQGTQDTAEQVGQGDCAAVCDAVCGPAGDRQPDTPACNALFYNLSVCVCVYVCVSHAST